MSDQTIRTLVVDDSIFMRTVLKSALAKHRNVEVIGSAQNGLEAIEKIERLKPDVVTLDIEMPGLDGLEVLRQVMSKCPLPVVMVSTKTQAGAQATFEALELGAVDFVPKPMADKEASLERFQEKVIRAVEAAFASNRGRLRANEQIKILRPRKAVIKTEGVAVAIGISAGGPATLHKLLPLFPGNFPPVVLTQHMPPGFTGPFADRLDAVSSLTIKEAKTGDKMLPGRLLLAPGDRHLSLSKRGSNVFVVLDDGPKVSGFKPSVDVMLESVARAYGADSIGLVMTGMGNDGANGIRALSKVGARTLAQDQDSSIVYGMPKAAYETHCVEQVVSLAEIPDVLVRLLSRDNVVV